MTDGKPIRFGRDGQEISPKEGALLIDELERMSGPENAGRRANAVVLRGGPRGRGRSGRGANRSPRQAVDGHRGNGHRGNGHRARGRGRG